MSIDLNIEPIGFIKSPFPTRFGIPRQPGLVPSAKYILQLNSTEEMRLALRGLTDFSHIWVLFKFHDLKRDTWKPLVQPPRLGGKTNVGVLATRSPYRPNGIGMSAVKIISVDDSKPSNVNIEVEGGDFLDGTPILDIKPYIPYADSIPEAECGWAQKQEATLDVSFSKAASMILDADADLRNLISETLSLDPRPGYERGNPKVDGNIWGVQIHQFNIKWTVTGTSCEVVSVTPQ